MNTRGTFGKSQNPSSETDEAARLLGVDPSTLPADLDAPTAAQRDLAKETADEFVERTTREHRKQGLTDAEALLLSHALFKRVDERNGPERTKVVWDFMTYVVDYGVETRDVPHDLIPERFLASGVRSALHQWFRTGIFERAQGKLDPLPFSEWSERRREQMSKIVAWELQTKYAAEKRRNKRIHDLAMGKNKR